MTGTMTDPVPSPCVRNCCLDERDICMGCFRSLQEIVAWGGADDAERQRILDRAGLRREAAGERRPPF